MCLITKTWPKERKEKEKGGVFAFIATFLARSFLGRAHTHTIQPAFYVRLPLLMNLMLLSCSLAVV
jgi:hypothetical protein